MNACLGVYFLYFQDSIARKCQHSPKAATSFADHCSLKLYNVSLENYLCAHVCCASEGHEYEVNL